MVALIHTIWGELDEGDGRVVVVNERLKTLPGRGVPDAAEAVVARGHDETAVAVEVDRAHGVGVRGQGLETLSCE